METDNVYATQKKNELRKMEKIPRKHIVNILMAIMDID